MAKTNPKRRPATEADVNKAWQQGVHDGIRESTAIFLTVLLDKYGMEDRIIDVWEDICKLSEEIAERRVSVTDLKYVLLKEYEISV